MGLEGLSFGHLLVVLLVVLVVFGTKRVRTLGSDLGSAIKGFRSAMRDEEKKQETSSETPRLASESEKTSESDVQQRP